MNPYILPPILGTLAFFFLTLFVYTSKPRTHAKKLFSLLCLETLLWQGFWLASFFVTSPKEISMIAKAAYLPITFLPFTFYHFVIVFTNTPIHSRSVKCFYLSAILLISMLFTTDLYVSGHRSFSWGNFAAAGSFYWAFVVLAILSLTKGLLVLLKRANQLDQTELERNQNRYLLLGLLFYAFCSVDFPQVYGVDLYPIGTLFFLASFSIISYAITKHQILDIEVVIRRTAVFAGLFAFAYGIFTLLTIAGQELLSQHLGWNQWLSAIPTALIITFGLKPLEKNLTNVTEKFLFQKKYDYRALLKTFTNEVLTILDLQRLTDQTVIELNKIIKLESATILTQNRDSHQYCVASTMGVKDTGVQFSDNDTLIAYLNQTHEPILKNKDADHMQGHSHLREDFKKLNAQLCLPIAHHDDLTGVLCLGMKKSGEEFTAEDVDILMTLARTLAIAIANAQLFDQLSKTQAEAAQREKMAVIGTLAAGINHEICNPLGIVRGQCEMFLLNLRDGLYSEKTKEDMSRIASEIMEKVIKETDRATAITKRLSGFAKPAKKVDMEEVYVEKEGDEVIGLIGHDLKLNNIEFTKNFSSDFPAINADKRQIQEVLFNIIRNAAQAMDKKEGKIQLSGVASNGMAVVKISDNGSGIPADKMSQIFNPFFTTKEPGKGTGLGLFIVRQVIERNKGTIAVDSQEGVGTTFTLTFPAAAAQAKVLAA